jgi:hypothetical protein
MEGDNVGHTIEKGPPKDHPSQICINLVQRFQRRKWTQILTAYILGFSVRFFQPVYSVYEYYEINITSKSFAQKFLWKLSLGGSLSKLCVTPHFLSTFDVKLKTRWAITGSMHKESRLHTYLYTYILRHR